MKKIALIACIITGYSYGMDCPKELDVVASCKTMHSVQKKDSSDKSMHEVREIQNESESLSDVQDIKNVDKTVRIDIANPDLIGQWQDVSDAISMEGTDDNIFETSSSTYKEGRFWTIVRKVFQPLQITASASTMVLITASEAVKSAHPSVSTGLSYGALGTAVTSGVLSLFITKMNSRISQLNKIYRAKLAAEDREIDLEEI